MADDWNMDDAPAPAPAGGNEFGRGGLGDNDMPDVPAAANDADRDWEEDGDYVASYVAGPQPTPPAATNESGAKWADGHEAPPPSLSPPATTGYGGSSGARNFMQNFDPTGHSVHLPAATPSTYDNAGSVSGGHDAGGCSGYGGAYTREGQNNTLLRPSASLGSAKLFIGNLGHRVDEAALRREFEIFGAINTASVIFDLDTGRSRGFGYVEFVNGADAAQAMALKNGAEVDGRSITIDFTTSGSRSARSSGAGGVGGRAGYDGRRPRNPESETLFVGGLSSEANTEMLRGIFGAHGTVADVRIPTDHSSGAMKGFAYVIFQSMDDARRAMESMNGAYIAGRNIRLDYAAARTGHGEGGGGGANNHPAVKLKVGNFSDDADEYSLRELFQPCGEVTDVYVPKDGTTGLNRGIAFVSFSTIEEAVTAHDTLNGADLAGKNIHIDYAEVRQRPAKAPVASNKPPSLKLFVGSISEDAMEDDLRQLFEACGELTDVYVPKDADTGAGKGFAFVSYSTVNDAIAAMQTLNGAELGGKSIRLDYAEAKKRGSGGADEGRGSKPPSHKLFLRNISQECSEDDLRKAFGAYGEVTNCFLPHENGGSKGIAFLSLSTVEGATAAKDALDGTEVAGENIRIDFAETNERAPKGGGPKEPSSKLFIGNIPNDCTEEHLREAFGAHGKITDCYIPQDNGMNKGIAFCSLSSVDEATAAKEALNGTEIAGETIRIDFSEIRTRQPRKSNSTPSLKLFIGNVSEECTEEHLRDAFGAHGEITDAYIPKNDNGANRGIAFLSFSSIEEAIAAKEALYDTEVAGKNIRIDFAQVKERAPRSGGGSNAPSMKLFIGGISAECTDDDLRKAFSAHAEVTDTSIPKDDDGANRGIGFVSFSSVDEATAAKDALDDTEIAGETIRIDFAQVRQRSPRESNNRPSLKLVLFGISTECTEDDLREAFSPHGEVTDAFIPKDEYGANKGIGFVSFSSIPEASLAKDALSGAEIAGEIVRIDFAQVRERPPKESNSEPSLKVFISGISAECTDDDLRQAFEAHGEVTDVFIPKDENDQNRGIAFVSFSSIDQASVAKDALSGTEIAGESIRIAFAQVKERAPREVHNPPAPKLFVGGVSEECNEEMLREFFAECGELIDVHVAKDEMEVNKGFAYVTFSSVEEATTAVETCNGKECAGSAVRLDYAEAKERRPREARPIGDPTNEPSNTLFVGGISVDTTVEVIKAAFAPHGSVLDVRIPIDPEDKSPRGFCYVAFATMEEAMAVVRPMNGAEIEGRQVHIDFAGESDGDPNKPRPPNVAQAFDPNEAVHSRLKERNTYIAAEINVPDRFELFLLQEGEKKISEAIDTRTPNSSIFTILKEDHTLCNLLRAHLLQNPAVLFAGYKIPHPLFAKVELRVQTDGSITPKEAVVQCSKKLVSDLGQFSREFTKEFELRKMVANAGSGPQIGL